MNTAQTTDTVTNAHRALVLNTAWMPIETVTWEDAFKMVFNGRAKAIDYYDVIVRTPNDEFFVPAVLVLNDYFQVPKRTVIYSKRLVCERDNWTCQYCRKKLTTKSATIDHVRPRCLGGRSNFENCVASCEPCNSRKANKPLSRTKFKLIKQPRRPFIHPLQGKIKQVRPEWEPYLEAILKR